MNVEALSEGNSFHTRHASLISDHMTDRSPDPLFALCKTSYFASFSPSKEFIDDALQALQDDQRTEPFLEEVEDGDKRFWTWADLVPHPAKPGPEEVMVFRPLQQPADFLEGVECRKNVHTARLRNGPCNREFSCTDSLSTTIKSEISESNSHIDACIIPG